MSGRWNRWAGAVLVLAAVATLLQWAEPTPVAAGPTWYETQCSVDRRCPGWVAFFFPNRCDPVRDDSCPDANPVLWYDGLDRGKYRWHAEVMGPMSGQAWVLPPSQSMRLYERANPAVLSLLHSDGAVDYSNDWQECHDRPPDRGRCPNQEESRQWKRLGRLTEGVLAIQIPTMNARTIFLDPLPTAREGAYILINQAIASGNYQPEPGQWATPYKATCWPDDYWLWLHRDDGEATRQTRAYSPYMTNRDPPAPPSGNCERNAPLDYEEAASGSRTQRAEVAYVWWRMEHILGDLTGRIVARPRLWGLTSDWELNPQTPVGEEPSGVLSCVVQSTIRGKRSLLPNWFVNAYYDARFGGDVQVPPTLRSAIRRPSNGENLSGRCTVIPMQALPSTFPGAFVKGTTPWPPEVVRYGGDPEPEINELTARDVLILGKPGVGALLPFGAGRRYVLYEDLSRPGPMAGTGTIGIWGSAPWTTCSQVRAPGEGNPLFRRGCIEPSESFQLRWYSPALWGWQGGEEDGGRFLDKTTAAILNAGDYLSTQRYEPHIALSDYVSRYLEGRRTHKRDPLGAGYSSWTYRERHMQLVRCSDSPDREQAYCLRQVDGRAVGLVQYQRIEGEHCRTTAWQEAEEADCLPEWLARFGLRLRNLPYYNFSNIDYFWGHSEAGFVRAWSDGRYYPAMECNGEVVDANRDPYHAPSPCGRSVPAAAITWQARVNDWSNLGGPA